MRDGWRLSTDGVLDFRPLLAALANAEDAVHGANLFHGTLAVAMAEWVLAAIARSGGTTRTVAFSGGCFYNQVLSADLGTRLEAENVSVLRPALLGPGDPAISLGQAFVASQIASATMRGV